MELIEKAERCHGCGTKRGDMLDERGQWLEEPAYEVVVDDCPVCRRIAAADAEMRGTEVAGHAGKRVALKPNDDLLPDASGSPVGS